MAFTSVTFLLFYLPIVLLTYFLLPTIKLKNTFLLLAGLLYYYWGGQQYVLVMIFSIFATWFFGYLIAGEQKKSRQKLILGTGIIVHLGMLLFFKYANFFVSNIIMMAKYIGVLHPDAVFNNMKIYLPIGISFFTFQSISYLIDVYRSRSVYQKSPLVIGMYKSLFPLLIAGPIVRYVDIKNETAKRIVTFDSFSIGVERFIIGLAQKVLIADVMGNMADQVFGIPAEHLTPLIAWLGAIAYTLQIYYDFAGYSSMAIGLGRMFGFKFLENFNFPYASVSITDFWRRWHISLSSWFRDYLYIPLGGNRCSKARNYMNLFAVFILCGFWHGAGWTFIFWGIFHGSFLTLEKAFLLRFFSRIPTIFSRIYTIFVVMVGWVVFRSESLSGAADFIKKMFGLGRAKPIEMLSIYEIFNYESMVAMFIGIVFSFLFMKIYDRDALNIDFKKLQFIYPYAKLAVMTSMFFLSILYLSGGTFNPFIYSRF